MKRGLPLLLTALLAGCTTRFEPPAWLFGTWTSRRSDIDTSWFEWTFREGEVWRSTFEGLALYDELDLRTLGIADEVEPGAYTLTWVAVSPDVHDIFLQTGDPDAVVWRSESPFHVVPVTESTLARVPDE